MIRYQSAPLELGVVRTDGRDLHISNGNTRHSSLFSAGHDRGFETLVNSKPPGKESSADTSDGNSTINLARVLVQAFQGCESIAAIARPPPGQYKELTYCSGIDDGEHRRFIVAESLKRPITCSAERGASAVCWFQN